MRFLDLISAHGTVARREAWDSTLFMVNINGEWRYIRNGRLSMDSTVSDRVMAFEDFVYCALPFSIIIPEEEHKINLEEIYYG